MPNVIMPNAIMPNFIMSKIIMANVIMPNVIMPNGIMPNVIIPNITAQGTYFSIIHCDLQFQGKKQNSFKFNFLSKIWWEIFNVFLNFL